MSDSEFASRGGQKLAAALDAFAIGVADLVCADFGSHAGGFVDCLLKHGAARVHAVDTGYGILAYRLRKDPRVVVCERQNALHYHCPVPCDLITIDVGWTPQRLILPAARRSLKGTFADSPSPQGQSPSNPPPSQGGTGGGSNSADARIGSAGCGRIITLVKPHYEAPKQWLLRGVLRPERLAEVLDAVRDEITRLAWRIDGEIQSPIKGHGGNVEFLFLLSPDFDQAARQDAPNRDQRAAAQRSTGRDDSAPAT